MSDKSILQQLRENNPFSSSASPMPFDNTYPDLAQLNRDTSEEIEQLIRHKRRKPAEPLAGLIIGGPGSGKTHMLTRILRRLRGNAGFAVFAAVKVFTDSHRVNQELLSELFISLTRLHSNGRTQFDMLLAEMMNAYHERRRDDGFASTNKIEPRIYLARDMPGIDRLFLKAILFYLSTSDETVKADILEWLREGLDDDDSLRIGLPSRDVHSMDDEKCESMARKFLTSLGLILGYARVPMVVCFDQLDAMRDKKELIEAWSNVVDLLVNSLSGVLVLCFVKPETWTILKPVLDKSIRQRVEANKMLMKECSQAQAFQLIHERINSAFRDDAEEKYQWLLARVKSRISEGCSPRMVIDFANKAITGSVANDDSAEIFETVENVYQDECRKIGAEPKTWPPNTDHLALALEVWLTSHEGFTIYPSSEKNIKFFGEYGEKRSAFIVITSKSHFVVSAGLKKGTEFLRKNPDAFCCYVSDDRTHKKTWKQANENLSIFNEAGGRSIILDSECQAKWYGLTSLINMADNGDINLYLSSGNRPATREDIKSFVKTLDLLPGLFGKEAPDPKPDLKPEPKPEPKPETTIVIEPDVLKVNLKSVINSSPMKIITLEKALSGLEGRKVRVSRTELLAFIETHKDEFRTYKSSNDVMLAFAKR